MDNEIEWNWPVIVALVLGLVAVIYVGASIGWIQSEPVDRGVEPSRPAYESDTGDWSPDEEDWNAGQNECSLGAPQNC